MQIPTITTQQPELYAYFTKWFVGFALTALVGTLTYPVRSMFRTAKQVREEVAQIKAQVNTATTNHLHTIQENTGKTVEILQELRKDQAELVGYLKGLSAR